MTQTLYVETIFWSNCDPLLSIAGYDRKLVHAKAAELAKDEIDRAVEDNLFAIDNPDEEDESSTRDNLETEMRSTGVHEWTDISSLGIPTENVKELETETHSTTIRPITYSIYRTMP